MVYVSHVRSSLNIMTNTRLRAPPIPNLRGMLQLRYFRRRYRKLSALRGHPVCDGASPAH